MRTDITPAYLFDPALGPGSHLIARWLFLRGLGAVYFSAFFALIFQVRGLIGSHGILPAGAYLRSLAGPPLLRLWYVPSLLWFWHSDRFLMGLCWFGLAASTLLILNLWPRAMLITCFVSFLSFVAAAQEFSGYQSDGMLLEAGFLAFFLAPSGFWPGWGAKSPGIRAAWLLLIWEWFRIYFQSGLVKLESGDPTWRDLTALYEYYQNGPLPTWIGWYLQHLPNWFHIATAGLTLIMELVLVWMAFLPRRWKILCVILVTVWQAVVIATANYAFLNYLVLLLALLLLDDRALLRFVPARVRNAFTRSDDLEEEPVYRVKSHAPRTAAIGFIMIWIFYATTVPVLEMTLRIPPLPPEPVTGLEPFRIANRYGLFAVMTPHRYEIEFQGSNDGANWTPYPFRYKPQNVSERPRIYAPYQPRLDWNLWFASLGPWQENPMVPRTEQLLLQNDADVLGLFAGNPFPNEPPQFVRAVLWQYWFSSREEKRTHGVWWRRQFLGTYAPTLVRMPDGRIEQVAEPTLSGPPAP